MILSTQHRTAARAIWEHGGRLDEVAQAMDVRETTIRRWLARPEFRALLAEESHGCLLQATSAVIRWAPAAVARLIRDLDGESAADARSAAREILKLAIASQADLRRPDADTPLPGSPEVPMADDPFTRRIARLSDDQLKRMLEILNGQ